MKIAVLIPHFSISGVPLAQIRLARAMARRGHAVTVIIGWVGTEYTLPNMHGLRVMVMGRERVIGMFFPLCRYLWNHSPDVVFSAEDHLNCIVLLAAMTTRSAAKVSCSSRVTPFDTYSVARSKKNWVLKQLMRVAMRRADVLTCVSEDMVKQYQVVFGCTRHICIYNVVDDQYSRERMTEPVEHEWFGDSSRPLIVAAGRLAPWKGFSDLIRAMSLGPADRGARLLILGDGPLRSELQTQIGHLRLNTSVQLIGYVDNPLKYFARADVFVLSSLVEGLPNVLVEAMMCGCTPVSTDCPTGPREVLDDGRIGYLVPVNNPAMLAAGIQSAIEVPTQRDVLEDAIRPFKESAVIGRHFEALGLQV